MKIFLSRSGEIKVMENGNRIGNGRNAINISPGLVIRSGDIINISGHEYIALDYDPIFFRGIAERGAQTIDVKDSAYMIRMSGIKYGSRVMESGTGSGALTSSILSMTGNPSGYIGIDHNPKSIRITKENIQRLNGFDIEIIEHEFSTYEGNGTKYDAIFLDLPEPWMNVAKQREFLESGKRVVTYLPNYDQVEKNVLEYEKQGFFHLETVELIRREILVREGATRPSSEGLMHTAFISTFVKKSGSKLNV